MDAATNNTTSANFTFGGGDDDDADGDCNIIDPDNILNSAYFQSAVYSMYAVIFVVALIGNGFVCYIVLSSPRMRTVTNYFIMNLAVGDVLITLLCVPFTSVFMLKQYWPFGRLLCPVVNYSQALSVFVSAYTLVAISIDKFMIIMWPLRPRISKGFATSIIALVWLIAGITVLPTGTFAKLTQPTEPTSYERCDKYICREDYSEVGEEYRIMYTKILMFLQYIIPSVVLLVTYTSIAVVIWCHRIPGEAENSRDKRIARSKTKMIKMMVTMVFVFTLCWLPYNIFLIVSQNISEKVQLFLYFPLHGLAMSHSCYNPIIYCYMNARFRDGLIQVVRSIPCLRRCITPLSTSSGFPHAGIDGSESTVLHRNNTSTTYISMKRKNCNRISTCNHQLPVRSASLMRGSSNHQSNASRRIRYSENVMDEQI